MKAGFEQINCSEDYPDRNMYKASVILNTRRCGDNAAAASAWQLSSCPRVVSGGCSPRCQTWRRYFAVVFIIIGECTFFSLEVQTSNFMLKITILLHFPSKSHHVQMPIYNNEKALEYCENYHRETLLTSLGWCQTCLCCLFRIINSL